MDNGIIKTVKQLPEVSRTAVWGRVALCLAGASCDTIKRLDILRSMYGQIAITEAVHREVVTERIAFGKTDANLFGKGD